MKILTGFGYKREIIKKQRVCVKISLSNTFNAQINAENKNSNEIFPPLFDKTYLLILKSDK
jgi:hypothetical protein